jgi:hypothetical protein
VREVYVRRWRPGRVRHQDQVQVQGLKAKKGGKISEAALLGFLGGLRGYKGQSSGNVSWPWRVFVKSNVDFWADPFRAIEQIRNCQIDV